jgi:hypothetical protein
LLSNDVKYLDEKSKSIFSINIQACVKFGLIVCRRKGTINKKNEKCNERQKGN